MKAFIQFKIFAVLLVVMLSSCSSTSKQSDEKETVTQPNIIVILCDDLGYADVGFNGGKDAKTPALDALANGGTICSAGYVVHPFCGPSRAGLMTGRYPHTIGSQFNLPHDSEITVKSGVPLSEVFISQVLKDAGYYTGIVGKWHLGAVKDYFPNDRGFDDFYGFPGGGHDYFPEQFNKEYNKRKEAGDTAIFEYLLPIYHNGVPVQETEYLTDAFSREACRFVTEASEKKKPFFLYLAYNAPHAPMEAKDEDLALFENIEDKGKRIVAAMVHAVDRGVEKLVSTLKETGEYDNTLIVFLSDNGGKLKLSSNNYPLTGGKGDSYEGGYRVPMFFHWASKVPAGRVFDYPVSAVDFYPTFANLAGAKIPVDKVLDGKDIWSDFIAGNNPHSGEMIYCLRHRTGYNDVGARKDDWKALKTGNQPWQLINIKEDISEKHDLSKEHPEILNELVAGAKEWSLTHIHPHWFNSEQEGIDWKEDDMPRYDETFKVE